MDQLKETLELDLDEHNELQFKVVIEGADEPAKVRLVCEGSEMAYMFNGYSTSEQDVVQFNIPEMKSKMNEGSYDSRVEVMVGNKYFTPVEFNINFKKQVQVFAESVTPKKVAQKPAETKVSVSAIPVVINKSKQSISSSSLEESRKKRLAEQEAFKLLKNKSKKELEELMKDI